MEVIGLMEHTGDLQGFFLLRAERSKLAQLRFSDEFRRIVARGRAVVETIGVVPIELGNTFGQFVQTSTQQTADITGE